MAKIRVVITENGDNKNRSEVMCYEYTIICIIRKRI